MVQLSFAGYLGTENNPNALLFDVTFSGTYGVNGVGDPLNLAPEEPGTNPGGVLDPDLNYDLILDQPPGRIGVYGQDMGGSYINAHNLAPAVKTLLNTWALKVYEPGGTEKATNAAYGASELGKTATLMIRLPKYQ